MNYQDMKALIINVSNEPSAARRAVEAAENFTDIFEEDYAKQMPPDKAAQEHYKRLVGEYLYEKYCAL